MSSSVHTHFQPEYEEIVIQDPSLLEKIKQVDQTIYKALYLRQIAEKDIFFSAVTPMNGNGHQWDFTELLIKLPEENIATEIENIIHSELSNLDPSVICNIERVAPDEFHFLIFVDGLATHKLTLRFHREEERFRKHLPKIAIIIDDLGYDLNIALSFIHFDLPLSLSILPIAPYTKHIVYSANKMKCEIILHLPLEPNDFPRCNPGPGALLVGMDNAELERLLRQHLNKLPGLQGVNNHMGSLFTEREDKMTVILSLLKRENLFYVDSKTSNRSVGYDLAKDMGVPVARRSVFLDNDQDPQAVRFQMERLMGLARYTGDAIGIGHPHGVTLEILREYVPQLKKDFEVVYVSELVD
ncbi:MAG: divergent polysaccharide deacetylase family protein [Deltaproteobacteria bacterium]|nr:divergent polysaccharide deacetylase family protein [Deltaproteobacteria bacterium]